MGTRLASIVLPDPGGPSISNIMPSAGRDGTRTFRHFLAAHVGEIHLVSSHKFGKGRPTGKGRV